MLNNEKTIQKLFAISYHKTRGNHLYSSIFHVTWL